MKLISRSTFGILSMILPCAAADEPGIFDNPLALFQKAAVPMLSGSERGEITTTLRGFQLRAPRQSEIHNEATPSESGIHMDVAVRDAVEIPAAVDTSETKDGITHHIIKFPAPSGGDQGLAIYIDSGASADREILRAIDHCIEEIRGRLDVERTPTTLKTGGPQPFESVLYAPDHQHYVAWFDSRPGPVLGEARTVVFRATLSARDDDASDYFSFATAPAWTQAAWNSASTSCVITDQPDNGSVFAWLISTDKSHKWSTRKIDPLVPVYAAYKQAMGEKDLPMFRPALDRIEWLSDTRVRFLIWSNLNDPKLASSGRFWVTIDTLSPQAESTMERISDK